MSFWHFVRLVPLAAVFALSASGAALAQQQAPPAAAEAPEKPAAPAIPEDLVRQLIEGDSNALTAATAFLVGSGARKPEDIARRATALISSIGANKGAIGTDALLRLIDRIASDAIGMVAGSQIVRLGIDKDFIPRRAVLAWDFGPPDGTPAPGFEKVRPGDGRIGGAALSALRRPADNTLLQDGISGVERIEADVPDGEYRIILMTQNLGDSKLMASPFGSEIVVNGSATPVGQPSPESWARDAIFSNKGLQNVAGGPGGGGGPGAARGFVSGDLSAYDPAVFQRQQGGAIILQATARGGKLIIELKGFGANARSYLTGLMVEPASQTSDLVLSREAVQALAPVELRLALEESILAAAASVLAQVDPADGDHELVELPETILDPEENASASS